MLTRVYNKPTNTGLLLHYYSNVDNRYKKTLVNTMVNRAHKLSSNRELFLSECDRLKQVFAKLKYPSTLVNSTIQSFIAESTATVGDSSVDETPVHITLPFRDQKSADVLKKQLRALGRKIDVTIQPIFKSRKIADDIRFSEPKPNIVNEQCVVYKYECPLCETGYVGYTTRHLFQRIDEHQLPNSAISRHLQSTHNTNSKDIQRNFSVLKKCRGKLDCLIHEMLYIKQLLKPSLNKQSDSVKAKVFI